MSPLELVDDRFEKLAEELRGARPVAPAELRERVRTLAPPPRRRLELPSLRRVVPAVALAGAAAALAVAGVAGLVMLPDGRLLAAPTFDAGGGLRCSADGGADWAARCPS